MTKRRFPVATLLIAGLAAGLVYTGVTGPFFPPTRAMDEKPHFFDSRVRRGFEIAPVKLNLRGKNRALVGLGSYLVNAQSACIDCHSCPSFINNPFDDGNGSFNPDNYLAGGVAFGPEIVSANLTPDANGLPAGLTREEFISLIRTGVDPDEPDEILQVMPWPIFRNMTDRDLMAIYEYLSAIPHAEPGTCTGPGQG